MRRKESSSGVPGVALAGLAALVLVAAATGCAPTAAQPSPTPDCAPRLELDEPGRTLSLRGLDESCRTTIAEVAALIEREPVVDAAQDVESLFLGRIVRLPELGTALLAATADDEAWDAARDGARPPPPGAANRLVAKALGEAKSLRPIREALASRGLPVRDVECEKVLVVIDHPSIPEWAVGKSGLPFDAMCWLVVSAR